MTDRQALIEFLFNRGNEIVTRAKEGDELSLHVIRAYGEVCEDTENQEAELRLAQAIMNYKDTFE